MKAKPLQIGEECKRNDRYHVPDRYKNKVFTVIAGPQDVCGTICVWLEGVSGAYAMDGLTRVRTKKGATA